MFKYLKGFDIINFQQPEMLNNNRKTRCHNIKLTGNIKRHKFFTNRVVNEWSKLEQEANNVVSVDQFKNEIDEQFKYFYLN